MSGLRITDARFRVHDGVLTVQSETASVDIPVRSMESMTLKSVFWKGGLLRSSKPEVLIAYGDGKVLRLHGSTGRVRANPWLNSYIPLITALAREGLDRIYAVQGVEHIDVSERIRFIAES